MSFINFSKSLEAYRSRWPEEGYPQQAARLNATYRYLAQFFSGGTVLDVGGWRGILPVYWQTEPNEECTQHKTWSYVYLQDWKKSQSSPRAAQNLC